MTRIKTQIQILCLIASMIALGLIARAQPLYAAELLMFETKGCPYCALWRQEIGVIYPKTAEGALAPLRVIDMHKPMPDDLVKLKPVRYSPTFILFKDNEEIGRITGYPGEDFFWPMLANLLETPF